MCFAFYVLGPCFLIYCAFETEKGQSLQRLERHLYTFLLISAILIVGFSLAFPSLNIIVSLWMLWQVIHPFFLFYWASQASPVLYTLFTAIVLFETIQAKHHNCKPRITRRWTIATLYIVGPFFPDPPLSVLIFVHSVLGAIATVEFVLYMNDVWNELE